MTIRRFRSGHGSLGGIPRGVPPQRWKMKTLWRAQDLRRRVRKAGAGPQVAVAFENSSDTTLFRSRSFKTNAADKLAVSNATATCGPVPDFGKRRQRSWALHRALIFHIWPGTPLRMPPRLPWPDRNRRMVIVNIGRPILLGNY